MSIRPCIVCGTTVNVALVPVVAEGEEAEMPICENDYQAKGSKDWSSFVIQVDDETP